MSKTLNYTLAAVLILVIGWFAGSSAWTYCRLAKQEEAEHMNRASTMLGLKLAEYFSAHGRYPDSLDSLSFTNSAEEMRDWPDIRKISYQSMNGGLHYGITYTGFWGYKISAVSNNNRKREQ